MMQVISSRWNAKIWSNQTKIFSLFITNYNLKNGKDGSRFVIGGYDLEKYAKEDINKI
jgi:hypothetical protein